MPNRLSNFWNELKRRRVVHVIVVFASAAFVILELTNNITEPLNLPDWTPTLVIVILLIGFPLAIIFSWIFDVTPEGIEKTKPAEKLTKGEITLVPNSWRIATYVSVVIIVGLIAFNIFGTKRGARIDESLAKSIAVLPFLNLSGDDTQDYMSVGITDEILSNLFMVSSFDEVRSLTSVLKYLNSQENIKVIAEELDVNYILEGSFKRIGDELKITAQLIETSSDSHIWVHDYDLAYKEVIGVPGEIAIQIADQLRTFITGEEKERIQKIQTNNEQAYEILQRALVKFNTFDFDMFDLGPLMSMANTAIEFDPDYADAYAWSGLFRLFSGGLVSAQTEPSEQKIEAGKQNIQKAIELDPDCYYAHLGMGFFIELREWDYVEAEREYLKFLELVPNYNNPTNNIVTNAGIIPEFYVKMNRPGEARVISNQLDNAYVFDKFEILSGDFSVVYKAIEHKKGLGSIFPALIGEDFIWLQEFDSALVYLESSLLEDSTFMSVPRFQSQFALVYDKQNEKGKANHIIDQLKQRSNITTAGSPDYYIGWYYSWVGEKDSAFYWLEKAYENRSPEIPWLKVDPAFSSLKDDPRYWDLYERTGHKTYDDYMANRNQ